jgi:hypothetical protein
MFRESRGSVGNVDTGLRAAGGREKESVAAALGVDSIVRSDDRSFDLIGFLTGD